MPPTAVLVDRIATCIGIWETNRGGDHPKPRESALDTVAGVHASMATIEQATMPYAADAFSRFAALRQAAVPALAATDVASAEACCAGIVELLDRVKASSAAGGDAGSFFTKNKATVQAVFLGQAEVATMFAAETLRALLTKLRADVAKGKKLADAASSVPVDQRLGLGVASLKSYIRTAKNWGENRAGWQRLAVNRMPGNIGSRIEAVSVSKSGTALVIPIVGERVAAILKKTPSIAEETLVSAVAQANNPKEADYGTHVYETYKRLYL